MMQPRVRQNQRNFSGLLLRSSDDINKQADLVTGNFVTGLKLPQASVPAINTEVERVIAGLKLQRFGDFSLDHGSETREETV